MGLAIPDISITWSFNGRTLTNNSLVTIYNEKFSQGRIAYNISSLQLCGVGPSDAGAYTCTVSNGHRNITARVMLQVHFVGDRCLSERQTLMVGGEERGQLVWPESPVGNISVLNCPCPQAAISRQATRVCSASSDGLGGVWLEANLTECQFSSLAWDLCNSEVLPQ